MFIPVFIPINNNKSHGKGCMCPKCVEKERLKNLPKEYYEFCYAIPNKIYTKNKIFEKIRLFFIIIGGLLMLSPFVFINFYKDSFLFYFSLMLSGAVLIVLSYIIFDKMIKRPYQIEDKIYLERKFSKDWNKNPKDIKGYKLTNIELNWRYK